MTPEELEAYLEKNPSSFKTRYKQESLLKIEVYVASALRLGATTDEIADAVRRGIALDMLEGE